VTTTVQQLIDDIANSLTLYCEECGAACCNAGKIALDRKSARFFARKISHNGFDVVNLENGCEHLKDGRCAIYPDRPDTCRQFPLFLRHKTLFVATCCPAIPRIEKRIIALKESHPGLKVIYQ